MKSFLRVIPGSSILSHSKACVSFEASMRQPSRKAPNVWSSKIRWKPSFVSGRSGRYVPTPARTIRRHGMQCRAPAGLKGEAGLSWTKGVVCHWQKMCLVCSTRNEMPSGFPLSRLERQKRRHEFPLCGTRIWGHVAYFNNRSAQESYWRDLFSSTKLCYRVLSTHFVQLKVSSSSRKIQEGNELRIDSAHCQNPWRSTMKLIPILEYAQYRGRIPSFFLPSRLLSQIMQEYLVRVEFSTQSALILRNPIPMGHIRLWKFSYSHSGSLHPR